MPLKYFNGYPHKTGGCVNKISDIDVSLSHGQLYSTKHIIVLWFAFISSSLLITVAIISLVLSCIEWDSTIFFVGIMGILTGVGFLIVSIYCFVKDKKIKWRVSVWLEDAVKTTAFLSKVDAFRAGFQPLSVKIRVKFSLNGATYVRESSATCFGGKRGYLGTFKRFVDKKIEILYSPMYDEVLILKET